MDPLTQTELDEMLGGEGQGTLADLPEAIQKLIKNLRQEVKTAKKATPPNPPNPPAATPPNPAIPEELQAELEALRKFKLDSESQQAKESGNVELMLSTLRQQYDDQIAALTSDLEASRERINQLVMEAATAKTEYDQGLATKAQEVSDYRTENEAFNAYIAAGPRTGEGYDPRFMFNSFYGQIKPYLRQTKDGQIEVLAEDGQSPRLDNKGQPVTLSGLIDSMRSGPTALFFEPPPQSTGTGVIPGTSIPRSTPAEKPTIPMSVLGSREKQIAWATQSGISLDRIGEMIAQDELVPLPD